MEVVATAARLGAGCAVLQAAPSEIERYFEQAGQWITDHWWVVALIILGLAGPLGAGRVPGHHRQDRPDPRRLQGRWRRRESSASGSCSAEACRSSGACSCLPSSSVWRSWCIFLPLVLFGVVTAGIGFLCILPLLCVLVPVLLAVGIVVQSGQCSHRGRGSEHAGRPAARLGRRQEERRPGAADLADHRRDRRGHRAGDCAAAADRRRADRDRLRHIQR